MEREIGKPCLIRSGSRRKPDLLYSYSRLSPWQSNLSECVSRSNISAFPPKCFSLCDFGHYLTLFSEFFSTFPHGTCLLSDSCKYLALDGVYHPIHAAISSNATLRPLTKAQTKHEYGAITLFGVPFQRTFSSRFYAPTTFRLQRTCSEDRSFSAWANPPSLAATKGILVSFYSSA